MTGECTVSCAVERRAVGYHDAFLAVVFLDSDLVLGFDWDVYQEGDEEGFNEEGVLGVGGIFTCSEVDSGDSFSFPLQRKECGCKGLYMRAIAFLGATL
jgi:hypothetical protein